MVQEVMVEESEGKRILSVGGMWWRPKLWPKCLGECGMHAAEAESMRLLRKARGADAVRQAEESSGALAESQAFLSAG